jgi:hypothetical protein
LSILCTSDNIDTGSGKKSIMNNEGKNVLLKMLDEKTIYHSNGCYNNLNKGYRLTTLLQRGKDNRPTQ